MKRTTTDKALAVLRSLFVKDGHPRQLVSDNGPQFTFQELEILYFGNWNQIFQECSPPPCYEWGGRTVPSNVPYKQDRLMRVVYFTVFPDIP